MKYIKEFESKNIDIEGIKKKIVNAAANNNEYQMKQYFNRYKNFDFDFVFNDGYTPFLYSVLFNCDKTAKMLIDKGANINKTCDTNDDNGLIMSIKRNNCKMLDILIQAGADWNHKNKDGYDFLDYLQNTLRSKYKIKGTCSNIINKYPKKYKKYLEIKELNDNIKKYNL